VEKGRIFIVKLVVSKVTAGLRCFKIPTCFDISAVIGFYE